MNNKPDCHPDTPESGQQTPLTLPNPPARLNPDREHLVTVIVNEKGCAYVDATRTRSGATINTIFFDNGGTMKITIKYKPHPENGKKSEGSAL